MFAGPKVKVPAITRACVCVCVWGGGGGGGAWLQMTSALEWVYISWTCFFLCNLIVAQIGVLKSLFKCITLF